MKGQQNHGGRFAPARCLSLFLRNRCVVFLSCLLFLVAALSLPLPLDSAGPAGEAAPASPQHVRHSAPDFLTFEELVELSDIEKPEGELGEKFQRLLATPFLSNEAHHRGVRPLRPSSERLGPFLRAAFWNIERGYQLELMKLVFADAEAFKKHLLESNSPGRETIETIDAQLGVLQAADLLVLNEVDLGMGRSDYYDVARELAETLQMNYVFGVEFVEIDKLHLGLEEVDLEDDEAEEELEIDLSVDPRRYRGLHGSAVLSRYPIEKASILRLPVCYDWYVEQQKELSKLERTKRWVGSKVFLERVGHTVRHGGRMALRVDLTVPDLPGGKLTVISTHLENRSEPPCRRQQMQAILEWIRDIENPVVLAGDMNTTGGGGPPTSLRREIGKRLKNPSFWAQRFINWVNPVSLPAAVMMPARHYRTYLDPTRRNIHFFMGNREQGFFVQLEKFRFADGCAFDFRGTPERTINRTSKTLANSNHRDGKGFRSTFSLKRDYGGMVGRFKLDWFFIKPFVKEPRDAKASYRFAPHFPWTLQELNESVPDRLSDHAPLTVDLPFDEPNL
jgi:endonuclease/exonuclease/phosphatase family metal-dependent hydrolase